MENKNEGNDNKRILGEFNFTIDKTNMYGGNQKKDFIDAVPIML